MFPIPLGYVQLQRVVEFYSTHPELRDELAAEAGADNFVAGSAVFRADDALEEVEVLRRLASAHCH